METYIHTKTCTAVFRGALFTTAQSGDNHLVNLPSGEQTTQRGPSREHYSAAEGVRRRRGQLVGALSCTPGRAHPQAVSWVPGWDVCILKKKEKETWGLGAGWLHSELREMRKNQKRGLKKEGLGRPKEVGSKLGEDVPSKSPQLRMVLRFQLYDGAKAYAHFTF